MSSESDDYIGSCYLIGIVGIIVQLALGALSFSVLIYKRYREQPKRPWKIWALDTSKQGVSQILAHIVNVAISMNLSSKLSNDACIWYFTTNVLDNTLGVLMCIGVLRLVENYLLKYKFSRFKSGNYYSSMEEFEEYKISYSYQYRSPQSDLKYSYKYPSILRTEQSTKYEPKYSLASSQTEYSDSSFPRQPLSITCKKRQYMYGNIRCRISYTDWLVQFLIWNAIVIVSKSILFETEVLLNVPLTNISLFLLGWIQPYETFELILVIIVLPVIMNGLAFWIQDNFLMKQVKSQRAQDSPGDLFPVISNDNAPTKSFYEPLL